MEKRDKRYDKEADFQRKAMAYLKTCPGVWYKVSDRFRSGIPDILGWCGGLGYAIELKARKGTVSRLQLHVLKQLKAQGVNIKVCFTMNDVMSFVPPKGAKR